MPAVRTLRFALLASSFFPSSGCAGSEGYGQHRGNGERIPPGRWWRARRSAVTDVERGQEFNTTTSDAERICREPPAGGRYTVTVEKGRFQESRDRSPGDLDGQTARPPSV